jgi:hypothetical protein
LKEETQKSENIKVRNHKQDVRKVSYGEMKNVTHDFVKFKIGVMNDLFKKFYLPKCRYGI